MSGPAAPADARQVAARVLARVEKERAFAAAALDAALERHRDLSVRDRALTTELVYGVLRWRGFLDRALEAHAPRGLGGLDETVRAVLRVAAYQIVRLERVPDSAAVDAAVDAVKRARSPRLAGFVNAVLRAVARDAKALPPESEWAKYALPAWLAGALSEALGPEEAAAYARVSLEPAPVWVRTNRLRISAAELAARLVSERSGIRVSEYEPVPGALRVEPEPGGRVGDLASLPAYAAGLFTVQDAAAQDVVGMLAPAAGERVLDACAGRGGKTGAIVEAAGGDVAVDAADDQPAKLERLQAEMARLGHTGVTTAAVDLSIGAAGLSPPYDAALIDAPCTGSGVVARRPELRWRIGAEDVARLAVLQRVLLSNVAALVRPGGRLVYAVCSLLPAEGSEVVSELVRANPGWRLAQERRYVPPREPTDGFFAARLERTRT